MESKVFLVAVIHCLFFFNSFMCRCTFTWSEQDLQLALKSKYPCTQQIELTCVRQAVVDNEFPVQIISNNFKSMVVMTSGHVYEAFATSEPPSVNSKTSIKGLPAEFSSQSSRWFPNRSTGPFSFSPVHSLIPHNTRVISVACGDSFSLTLLSNGQVYSWGESDYGALGIGSQGVRRQVKKPVLIDIFRFNPVLAISAGSHHCLALLADDRQAVYGWGCGLHGRLGDGSERECVASPEKIPIVFGAHLSSPDFLSGEPKGPISPKAFFKLLLTVGDMTPNDIAVNGVGIAGNIQNHAAPPISSAPTIQNSIQHPSTNVNLLPHVQVNEVRVRRQAYGPSVFAEVALERAETAKKRSDPSWNFLSVSSVVCGSHHTLFMMSDGRIIGCGSNEHGQLGIDPNQFRAVGFTDLQVLCKAEDSTAAANRISSSKPSIDFTQPQNTVGDNSDITTTDRSFKAQEPSSSGSNFDDLSPSCELPWLRCLPTSIPYNPKRRIHRLLPSVTSIATPVSSPANCDTPPVVRRLPLPGDHAQCVHVFRECSVLDPTHFAAPLSDNIENLLDFMKASTQGSPKAVVHVSDTPNLAANHTPSPASLDPTHPPDINSSQSCRNTNLAPTYSRSSSHPIKQSFSNSALPHYITTNSAHFDSSPPPPSTLVNKYRRLSVSSPPSQSPFHNHSTYNFFASASQKVGPRAPFPMRSFVSKGGQIFAGETYTTLLTGDGRLFIFGRLCEPSGSSTSTQPRFADRIVLGEEMTLPPGFVVAHIAPGRNWIGGAVLAFDAPLLDNADDGVREAVDRDKDTVSRCSESENVNNAKGKAVTADGEIANGPTTPHAVRPSSISPPLNDQVQHEGMLWYQLEKDVLSKTLHRNAPVFSQVSSFQQLPKRFRFHPPLPALASTHIDMSECISSQLVDRKVLDGLAPLPFILESLNSSKPRRVTTFAPPLSPRFEDNDGISPCFFSSCTNTPPRRNTDAPQPLTHNIGLQSLQDFLSIGEQGTVMHVSALPILSVGRVASNGSPSPRTGIVRSDYLMEATSSPGADGTQETTDDNNSTASSHMQGTCENALESGRDDSVSSLCWRLSSRGLVSSHMSSSSSSLISPSVSENDSNESTIEEEADEIDNTTSVRSEKKVISPSFRVSVSTLGIATGLFAPPASSSRLPSANGCQCQQQARNEDFSDFKSLTCQGDVNGSPVCSCSAYNVFLPRKKYTMTIPKQSTAYILALSNKLKDEEGHHHESSAEENNEIISSVANTNNKNNNHVLTQQVQHRRLKGMLGFAALTDRIVGVVTSGSVVATTSLDRVLDAPRFLISIQSAWELSMSKSGTSLLPSIFSPGSSNFAAVLNNQVSTAGSSGVDLNGEQRDLKALWRRFGVPPFLRQTIWARAVGNDLRITADLFAIFSRRAIDLMRQISDRRALMNSAYSSIFSNKKKSRKFFQSPSHQRDRFFSPRNSLSRNSMGIVDDDDKYEVKSEFESLFPEDDDYEEDGGREATLEVIWVDLPRTFGSTGLFSSQGGALYNQAVAVLGSWVFFRPDVGYVQGMNYIAAVLLFHLEPFKAFQVFANLLTSPSLLGLFQLNREAVEMRYGLFDSLLQSTVPEVAKLLKIHQVPSDLFLLEWFLSLFAKAIPFRAALVIWDLVLIDGEEMLFLTAVALVRCLRKKMLKTGADFASIAEVLTNPFNVMGGTLTTDKLLKNIKLIRKKTPPAFFKGLKGLSLEYN